MATVRDMTSDANPSTGEAPTGPVARLDPDMLTGLHERIQREVDAGRLPTAQLAIGLDGDVVHTRDFGSSTPGTHYSVFSVTKALMAATVWQLLDERTLEVGTEVRELVPSFAAAEGVTLRHLLTHTGGFPYAPMGPPRWNTREGRHEQFARWRLQYPPGERFEYHATSAHWVIAEMVEVVEGRDYRDVVRERLLEPLGLDGMHLGGADAADAEVAELVTVGEAPGPAELQEVFGTSEVDLGEVTPEVLLAFNSPDVRRVGVPGGGAVSDAASIALLYQHLLHDPLGLWSPEVLAAGTAEVYCDLVDHLRGIPANRTLGLVLAGDDGHSALRGMGHRVSPRAFGHNGAAGQIAWADPETGMSFAFCTSAVERDFIHEARRTAAIATRASEVLPPAN